MGATYTRQSSYTDGDTITAAHTNDEFNQLLAAFAASTGHTHDGTTAEGGPITKLLGNTLTFGAGTSGTDITITFDGETSDGVLKWMEDEDYFEFSDDILVASTEKLQFRDTAIYINSSTDGQLDLVADSEVQIAATTIDINGNVDISGTLTIGSAGISEAELEILDGATVTTTELNILDGDTSATSTTVADADRVVFNDAGTMKQVAVTDLAAYFDDEITAMPNLTSVGTLTTLTVDNVIINGTTIGHTDDTDLITLADGIATVAGEVSVTTLDIGGTNVTSTAAELNILDGVTATTAELNLIDGDTTATSTTLAAADRLIVNDAGTMKQVALSDFETFFESALDTTSNITTVGALDSGSITSGFGTIDTGSSTITTTGLITGGSLDIDDVVINGTTIGHTDDTDLMTVADGVLTVAGEVSMTTLDIGGTNVTSTAAELNYSDTGAAVGTVVASKVVTADANKDVASFRNITLTGELDAGSLDVSGDADIDGTLEADAMTLNGTAITTVATLSTGISNGNLPVFTSGAADNDFLRIDGTSIEGRSASEVLSDISAAPAAGDSNIVTTGALNSGSITSGFGAIDNGSSAITTTGVITGGTVEATADTSAGDNAAIGYTAAEGLILTGQGSTNDVTIKNDADADVLEIPTGTTNVTVVGNVTAGGTVSGAHALSHRNMVNNGSMQISQRATSATGLGAANGYFAVDRFNVSLGATSAGRFTMSQSTVTDLEGFPNALKLDCTTADTSIAAGEALVIQQKLEGQDVQRLTATSTSTNAFTLSFYAKSNASRAIASEITLTNGTNVQISKLHTIGTSWARYTMTVPAASSTQIDDDNSAELTINFWVHAGSTYTSGTINDDALDSFTNGNRAAGIGSLFASTDNTLEITGLQLELGSVTPFEHRSFGDQLAACQRYYHQLQKSSEGGEIIIAGATSGGTNFNAHMFMPMRAAPTVTFPTSASVRQGGSTFNVSSWSASAHHPNGTFNLNASMASSATANTASFAYSFQNDISFDAEL